MEHMIAFSRILDIGLRDENSHNSDIGVEIKYHLRCRNLQTRITSCVFNTEKVNLP